MRRKGFVDANLDEARCPGCHLFHPRRSEEPQVCPCCTHPHKKHTLAGCIASVSDGGKRCTCRWKG